jgi:hypothetical protein
MAELIYSIKAKLEGELDGTGAADLVEALKGSLESASLPPGFL